MDHGGADKLHTAAQAGTRGICCVSRYHDLALINPEEGTAVLALDLTVPGLTSCREEQPLQVVELPVVRRSPIKRC